MGAVHQRLTIQSLTIQKGMQKRCHSACVIPNKNRAEVSPPRGYLASHKYFSKGLGQTAKLMVE